MFLETLHVLVKIVHEKCWRTEIFRSQSCRGQIVTHWISQTIRRIYFEPTEMLIVVIRSFLEIIWDIWIYKLEYFLLILLIVLNSVVIYFILFMFFRLLFFDLQLNILPSFGTIWLLIKFIYVSILF